MISDALAALAQIFTPPFRGVLWKSLGLTLLLLVFAWVGLDKFITAYIAVPYPWLATTLAVLTGLGLVVGLAFLVAPVSALVAGFFLDELADVVEHEVSPKRIGKALPAGEAMRLAIGFAIISIFVNFVALVLLLVPGVNVVAFLVANAYLAGREYFELAALRYAPLDEVRAMRREHGLYLFLCGLPIAAFLAVPVVNLLTPLFATAFMVRVHARLAGLR